MDIMNWALLSIDGQCTDKGQQIKQKNKNTTKAKSPKHKPNHPNPPPTKKSPYICLHPACKRNGPYLTILLL